jgi:mono/diheme cytochrome c family protein
MILRSFILIAIFTLILAACNYTLAEDVTPPPGYIPPTPMPTLVLSPAQAPSVESGRAIYAEKCAACHGETGLGDGAQGIQLGVTVPAFGLAEIARPATPADWFTIVTRGRMDRFMPPFASLNDEQRWDVVAYAMSLHISDEQAARGREIFETNCKDCSTDFFKDQDKMSAMSEVELARLAKDGNGSVPPFGATLDQDQLWDAAAYLRTLSFDYSVEQAAAPAPTSTPETVSVTDTPAAAEAETPTGEGTPVAVTEQASTIPTVVAKEGFGTVTGAIDNKTGEDLPAGMKVTLRGYEHSTDPAAGPQEVISQESAVNSDGTYTFANVDMPLNRIFIAEVVVDGITMQSPFAIVKEGVSSLAIPAIPLYAMTDDTSLLTVDEARLFIEYGDTDVQYYGVYSFRNPSDKTILVDTKGNSEIPFIKMPEGTSTMGYETLQDSAPIVNTDKGIAIPPSENLYGMLAFTSLPKREKFDVAQQFILPAANLSIFLPEGVTAQGANLTDEGVQNLQNFNFHVYNAQNIAAGETVKFSVSGEPKQTTSENVTSEPATNTTDNRQTLLIGAGLLGLALIVAGGWMYLRDRNRAEEVTEEEEPEFESSEDVLDAIVALDDLHRAGKIADKAYQKRRTELKDILKGMI